MSKRKKIDWTDVLIYTVCTGILVGFIGGIIWIRAAMPCSWMEWMPVQDVPARCLAVDVR